MIVKSLVLAGLILITGCSTPKALFLIEEGDKVAPFSVNITNVSKNAESYSWDCGNGNTSFESEPSCRYVESGKYSITLTAKKGDKQSQISRDIFISAPMDCLVEMVTSEGSMLIRLFDETPLHRDNFLKLAESGYYEGQLFHRVISGFMMQGGDPESLNARQGVRLGNGGPGYNIPSEIHKKYFHTKGALAAARLSDEVNPKKESSGSQFYIVHGRLVTDEQLRIFEAQKNIFYMQDIAEKYQSSGGSPQLDMEYTVFGEVIEGLEVIDKIANTPTDSFDRPKKDVVILKIHVIK
jgi:cyclophilin family peptidyl-prolyl cis-trans isomerase